MMRRAEQNRAEQNNEIKKSDKGSWSIHWKTLNVFNIFEQHRNRVGFEQKNEKEKKKPWCRQHNGHWRTSEARRLL